MRKSEKQASPGNTRGTSPTRGERRREYNEQLAEQHRRASDKQQEQFGSWLQKMRAKAGRTQDQCCEVMRERSVVLAKSDWSRIENGRLPLSNLYDKIPAMADAVRVSPLLMYREAHLTPPSEMEEAETSVPINDGAATEWERRAQYLEKLFVFCTNRILTALGQEEMDVQDLVHLRHNADELAALRAAEGDPAADAQQHNMN